MIVQILLSLIQVILVITLVYYYGLLLASIPRPKQHQAPGTPRAAFAIAIPAHNEELVIARTVSRLAQLNYPRDRFDIFVVADYCTDATAQAAREAGAFCFERHEGPRGRKAYPLQWLLQHILNEPRQYDAIVIFDADSQVDADFLNAMDAELSRGHVAVQGQHVIANPGDSTLSQLAAMDMRLNNLLRNRAKRTLGLSARLMGDAMCLTTELIRTYGWGGESLTEDREFEMYLLLHGQRVYYAPDAVSYGEATARWTDASKQRVRWYGGVIELQRKFAGPLLTHGVRTRNLAALDRALELILPSFSIASVVTLLLTTVHALLSNVTLLFPMWFMAVAAMGWFIFPFIGLIIDRAPAWTYRAMFYAPAYILWRIGQGLRAALKRGEVQWVRTRRREEQPRHV